MGEITAVLGPTNTGKTHYAIERMLGHASGVIGLPLRLLAREVYDRILAVRGPNAVALVTGEERIVPARAQYWVCTVEAMPVGQGHDFLAVDEIQLCADPERGHVFTDRLLHARGRHETLFLGSDTMRPAIQALVPKARFVGRQRFSTLTYTGQQKVSRMKPRSAIVGFSVETVYALAELLRRQKGGAAVVMGALSPRTRNAQVEMYQDGDVDYLVATDAIGMGLNLDVAHVAFSSTTKFDGRRMRPLAANELAQIAGRAGRHTANGTFGVTGEAPPLDPEAVEAIEESRFAPVRRLMWRNSDLDYGTVSRLVMSLERRTDHRLLSRARDADDLMALKALADDADVIARTTSPEGVRRLWEVCRIPDFRGIGSGEHQSIVADIFRYLSDLGRVPDDWLARRVKRIDRTDGDIDALSKRLAYVRTWTYVAQRRGWLDDPDHWRGATRAVEDRLSDALHGALTQRFVDRRTSVLLRRLKQKEAIVAEVNDAGEISVEGQVLGRLEGFRFRQERVDDAGEAKAMRQAAAQVIGPQLNLRADRFYNAPDTEIDFTEQGGLMWGQTAVGKLTAGPEPLKPVAVAFVDDEAGDDAKAKVQRRLQHFIDRKVAALFEPLVAMQKDDTLQGLARGFAFRLVENLGVIPRGEVASEVKQLGQDERGALRRHGVRFGQFTVFLPALLKPAPTRLRLVLWGLQKDLDEFPEAPPPGLVTIPAPKGLPPGAFPMTGYRASGERAIRIDMLERLADMIRNAGGRDGFEATPDMLSITGLTLEQFANLMQGLGYRATRGERPKPPREAKAPGGGAASDPAPAEAAPSEDALADALAEGGTPVPPEALADIAVAPGEAAPDTSPDGPDPAAAEAPAEEPAEPPAASEPVAAADAPTGAELGDAIAEGGTPIPAEALDAAAVAPGEAMADAPQDEGAAEEGAAPEPAADEGAAPEAGDAAAEAETEVFYTFAWSGGRQNRQGGRPRGARQGAESQGERQGGRGPRPEGRGGKPPQGKGGKRGEQGKGKGRGPKGQGDKPKTFAAGPDRKGRIDPANPFAAALSGLKDE